MLVYLQVKFPSKRKGIFLVLLNVWMQNVHFPKLREEAYQYSICTYTWHTQKGTADILRAHDFQFRWTINLFKPTSYVMHHQFNIQQLYALSTLYLCVLYLSENKQRLVPLIA